MTKLEKLVVYLAGASYFVIETIQVSLLALFVLPLLLLITLLVLRKNREVAKGDDLIVQLDGKIDAESLVYLLFMPFSAILFYAVSLSLGLMVPTNIIVYLITTPLGFLLFIYGIVRVLTGRA
ncbi:MAG: hypothetical protein DRN92_01280 [Thermoproteota archaeon]|nr:MAG: hypothetical protein DRN92_01280 [Candidatus Korarchaeota archaeon]